MNLLLEVEFLSHWLSGDGVDKGHVDRATKLEHGIPYVSGSQLKGVLRDAMYRLLILPSMSTHQHWLNRLYGQPGENNTAATVDAALCTQEDVHALKHSPQLRALLCTTVRQTSIDALTEGSKPKTLRSSQVARPLPLVAKISLKGLSAKDAAQAFDLMQQSLIFLERIGANTGLGWGRVRVSLKQGPQMQLQPSPKVSAATGQLEYTLRQQTEISLSASRSTTASEVLDYIPGSTLLGVAAAKFYRRMADAKVFTHASIRFGNGYSRSLNLSSQHMSYPLPLSLHREKDSEHGPFLNFAAGSGDEHKQYQQSRGGYIQINGADEAELNKPVLGAERLSGHEEGEKKAKSGALFNRSFIQKGHVFSGVIEWDKTNDELNTLVVDICEYLQSDVHYLGKAKSKASGEVKCDIRLPATQVSITKKTDRLTVWLLSDLALLDTCANPLLCPVEPAQLGLKLEGKLDTNYSYIRTRQYRPRNGVRGNEALRQVITQGSVLVFQLDQHQSIESTQRRIGLYRHEGLGHVWLQPPLLIQKEIPLKETEMLSIDDSPVSYSKFMHLLSDGWHAQQCASLPCPIQYCGKSVSSVLIKSIGQLYVRCRVANPKLPANDVGPNQQQWGELSKLINTQGFNNLVAEKLPSSWQLILPEGGSFFYGLIGCLTQFLSTTKTQIDAIEQCEKLICILSQTLDLAMIRGWREFRGESDDV